MEKFNLTEIVNKTRTTNKYGISLGQFFSEVFMEIPKTSIYFGSYKFETEEQNSIHGIVVNEHAINAAYHGMTIGSFDYIYLYSNNHEEYKVIFSRQCADRAYALYMFFMEGYRMKIEKSSVINEDLQGKTFDELMRNQQRMMRALPINCHEYNVFAGNISKDELGVLRKYLDEC